MTPGTTERRSPEVATDVDFTVFTKPWTMPLPELAGFVKTLGFDGVELPVRPGYQVEPETVTEALPEAARILADHGLKIGNRGRSQRREDGGRLRRGRGADHPHLRRHRHGRRL